MVHLGLSTNKFGNNHLDKNTRNKIFLEILDYNGVCSENFQRIEQQLEKFLAKFSFFFEKFVTSKFNYGCLLHQLMLVSVTADIICQHKSFQKLLKNLS